MSDTATFLAQVIPWPAEGQPGYVSVHSPWLRPGEKKPVFPGHAFTDLSSALGNVAWRVKQGNNTYACMSLQKDAASLKPNRRNRRAIRRAELALLLRAFWIDADTKNFADEQDLLTKFGVFRRAVGLPLPSLLIWSGGGFHFYWVLPEPITVDVWQPVADALSEAMVQLKFAADTGLTKNPACLMRIPGTANDRYDPPRLAKIINAEALVELADLEGPLAPYRTAYRPRVSPGVSGQRWSMPPGSRPSEALRGVSLGPPLTEGIESDNPPAAAVAAVCPWFDATYLDGGKDAREPEWFEALKVAYHTKEGQDTAHRVSDGHRDYDRQATDEKYATASASAEKYGWPQCQTIKSSGATQCAGCDHLKHNKSPLNFVVARPQATTSSATPGAAAGGPSPQPPPGPPPGPTWLPDGYRYTIDGFIEHEVQLKEGVEWQRMYPVRVKNFVYQEINAETGYGKEMFTFEYQGTKRWRPAQLTMPELHDLRQFRSVLSKQGMGFKGKQAEHMEGMMVSFVQQLKDAQHLSVECEPYGWSMKGGVEDAFTFDGIRFNCNGNRAVAPVDLNLGNKHKSTGDIAIWKEAAKLITSQKRPALDAIMACGLAAPLVQMTGHNGFVVSAYSTHTGVQKSAAMRVGHAMWGDPNAMAGLDDTNNFLNARLVALRHLPLYVDELKFTDDLRKAETMVLGITQGKGKGRLTRASETMETYSFNTMMITASNASLAQHIATAAKTTTAGMARIFEFVVAPHHNVGQVDMHVAQALIGRLSSNFGTAGRVYAERLGQQVVQVRKDVLDMCKTISDIKKATSEERFWVAAIAVMITGARYGNELGLTEINLDQLSRFLLAEFDKQRGETSVSDANLDAADNVEKFVVDFINAHVPQTLKTADVDLSPGKSTVKADVLNSAVSVDSLNRGVYIHAVRDQRIVRISVVEFRRWLSKERRVAPHEIVKKVKEQLPVTHKQASIGRGTGFKRAPEWVLEFDVTQMPSIDLF